MSDAIQRGSLVEATTANNEVIRMIAISGPIRGRDFPVVWVCTEGEWAEALEANEEPDGLPWPMTAIRILEFA